MGMWDALKSVGRGIAKLPGAINEARYSHETQMVPIGRNPDTGEEITIPAEELQAMNAMYDPASGQILRPHTQRTGMSGFGNFLSNGLPRMLDAGIAAATAPGNGQGGFLAGLQGMDIGRDRLEKRDMLAYQMQRQRINDEALDEQRRTQAEENRARAEMYRSRMEQDSSDPLAALKARAEAGGLVPGTQAYQDYMLRNGDAERPKTPWHNVGGAMFNEENQQFFTPPKPPPQATLRAKIEYVPVPNSDQEQAYHVVFNPLTGDNEVTKLDGVVRKRKALAAPRPRQSTPAQVEAAATRAAADKIMAEAGQNFDSAIALAKKQNASLAVQNLILDAKKKATPPAPKGSGKKSDIPTFGSGSAGWRAAKGKIIGGN